VNPADADLRNAEQALLYSLLDRAPDDQAPEMLQTLKPGDPWAFTPEDAETARLKKELRNECVTRLMPKVERAFVEYVGRPESLRLLATPEGSSSFRYVLFSPDRLPWGAVIRSALLETMQNAKSDPSAHEKANEFLQLLVDAAVNRANYISRQSAATIVGDREFVAALWHGATSKHIQFRMLRSYLSKREVLLQLGAQKDDLPLSPELAKAKETDGSAEIGTVESEADAIMDSDSTLLDGDESPE
jgi:hypothetical protein